jgi:multidrug efflux pump subunit AcrB
MNITQFAIEKKRITTVALLIILVSGILTYKTMPRDEDPGFIIRTAQVITMFPGASPERVEQLITDKLEKKIQEMPEVDALISESKSGVSIILVDIKESLSDMRPIWDNLRRKVDDAKSELPSGIIGPDVNDEFGDVFGTVIALTAEGYTYAEMKEIADDVRNELLLIPEAAKVDIHGAQEERVFVEFRNARLAELGISPGQLQAIIETRNIIFPGGVVYTDDEQMALEPSGNFESVEELRRTVIKLPGRNDLLYLGDVAEIRRGYVDPPSSVVAYKGERALILSASMRDGGNIITLGEDVKKTIRHLQEVYPIGVDFEFLYFQPYFVDKKVKDFTKSLVQAVVIVVVVMLLFLGLRTGLVIASLIPMAMVMALLVMGFLDIGLDQMSLAALIISLGLLVDNAIVMSESIMVRMSEGHPPVWAAITSASELRVPLLTSSLTTAAAFLPIYLAESTVGEYTAPIFEVVTITLISSWILALTMTPLLCVVFLKVKQKSKEEAFNTRFYRFYRRFLLALVRRPLLTLLGTILIFMGSMQLARFIPAIFFPANDKPLMYAEFELPIGTPFEKTESMVQEIDAFIKAEMMAEFDDEGEVTKHGIESWASFMGAGAPRFQLAYNPEPPSPEYAYVLFNTTDRERVDTDFIPTLEAYCRENFPDLTATIAPLSMGPPVEAPVQIRVSGKETDRIFGIADEVKAHLATLAGTKDIGDNWGSRAKKLMVRINQPRAQRAGLTSQDIAMSLQTVLSGIETTDYREDDEVIPVVLRSVAADRRDIGKLESHNIYVQATGTAVPLKQVADVEVAFQPSRIRRWDRQKTVTVECNLEPGFNAISVASLVDEWLSEKTPDWPVGYKYELGGEVESSGEANDSIMAKLPIAFLLIILLLVAQFDSIRRPVIILLTIPLGLIGIFIGLLITGQSLGFMAFLGVVALAGIVINNAIVLIDRIKIEIEENAMEPARAVIEASQRRLRPILLTTLTTVGGLIPLWLGGGAMFESMAVAILFGLLFASVLTLGFVPAMYALLFRVRFKNFKY